MGETGNNDLVVSCDSPGKIDCGPKLVNANLYRRDYYINSTSNLNESGSTEAEEYVSVAALQKSPEREPENPPSSQTDQPNQDVPPTLPEEDPRLSTGRKVRNIKKYHLLKKTWLAQLSARFRYKQNPW